MSYFSIITVVKNRVKTIQNTIHSVKSQIFKDYQYIVIDGGSTDGTKEFIEENLDIIDCYISEEDSSLYHALNKGIYLSKGKFICFLHSDDHYPDKNTLNVIYNNSINEYVDAVYGDVNYYKFGNYEKIKRHVSSKFFNLDRIKYGIMPGHTALFVRKKIYDKIGSFDTNLKIASDFEWMLRAFYSNKIKYKYIEQVLVNMNTGGLSSKNLLSRYLSHMEIYRSCKIHNVNTNWFKLLIRYLFKLKQFI